MLVIVEPAIVVNAGAVRKKTHLLGWCRYAGPGQPIVFDLVLVLSLTLGMVVMHRALLPLMTLGVGWMSSMALRKILLVVSAQQGEGTHPSWPSLMTTTTVLQKEGGTGIPLSRTELVQCSEHG